MDPVPSEAEGMEGPARAYLARVSEAVSRMPVEAMTRLAGLLLECRERGRLVLTMGNGGHGSTASHWVNDLSKHTVVADARGEVALKDARRFRCVGLNDSAPTLSAWANDAGWERAFAEQVENLAGPGDLVVAFTGSGNSANILNAFAVARRKGAHTVAVAGFDGGKAGQAADLLVLVPSDDILVVEDMHMVVCHLVTQLVRSHLQEGR